MKFAYVYLLPMAAEDFLRGPNWRSVEFIAQPFRWALGILLALVILTALLFAAVNLLKLAGSDRHKARAVGESLGISAVAIFLAMMFQPMFTSLLSSM